MEVKAIQAAEKMLPQMLPAPFLPDRGGSESPNPDKAASIGREIAKEAVRGSDDEKSDLHKLQEEIKRINETIAPKNIALNYSVDETTDEIVIKVVEMPSEKVIRQIPPDAILSLRGRLQEILGVIFDENV
jgi:flagellar protein FlaG